MSPIWTWSSWPMWVIIGTAVVGTLGLFALPVVGRALWSHWFTVWETPVLTVFGVVFGGGFGAVIGMLGGPPIQRWISAFLLVVGGVYFLIALLPRFLDQNFDLWPSYYFASAGAFGGSVLSVLLSSFRASSSGNEDA